MKAGELDGHERTIIAWQIKRSEKLDRKIKTTVQFNSNNEWHEILFAAVAVVVRWLNDKTTIIMLNPKDDRAVNGKCVLVMILHAILHIRKFIICTFSSSVSIYMCGEWHVANSYPNQIAFHFFSASSNHFQMFPFFKMTVSFSFSPSFVVRILASLCKHLFATHSHTRKETYVNAQQIVDRK